MSSFSWLQGRDKLHETARRRIIVIGAGAAGIAAARKLHDFNHQVTVLEAQSHIGGRVLTDYDMAPYPVELGAEFIHGDKVSTWALIKQFGFTTRPGPDDDYAYAHVVSRLLGPDDDWTDALETEWEDTRPGRPLDGVYYYLRIRQVDGNIAWLSPFWIDTAE